MESMRRMTHEQPGDAVVGGANVIWTYDFMQGPMVRVGNDTAKATLWAIMDEYSRMIVAFAFGVHEDAPAITVVLKDAFLTYGLPEQLSMDSGCIFASELLRQICFLSGVSLVHPKCYGSSSHTNMEFFLREVHDRFLPGLQCTLTLKELDEVFFIWLGDQYNAKRHPGTNQRPIDRYQASISLVRPRRLPKAELEEIFMVRHVRIVNRDSTITFKGRIYEVPRRYIRRQVDIRHPVDDERQIVLYDNGLCIKDFNIKNGGRNHA